MATALLQCASYESFPSRLSDIQLSNNTNREHFLVWRNISLLRITRLPSKVNTERSYSTFNMELILGKCKRLNLKKHWPLLGLISDVLYIKSIQCVANIFIKRLLFIYSFSNESTWQLKNRSFKPRRYSTTYLAYNTPFQNYIFHANSNLWLYDVWF